MCVSGALECMSASIHLEYTLGLTCRYCTSVDVTYVQLIGTTWGFRINQSSSELQLIGMTTKETESERDKKMETSAVTITNAVTLIRFG